MTSLLEWLLDLDGIRLGRDAPLLFRWDGAIDAWVLFACSLMALTFITVVYRRERAPLAVRVILGSVRGILVGLVIAVICRPTLILQRNRVEPSFVALALDTSQSMARRERYSDKALEASIVRGLHLPDASTVADHSRLALIKAALAADGGAAVKELLERNAVQLAAFSGHVETVGFFSDPSSTADLTAAIKHLTAVGKTTDLAAAIRTLIEDAQGRRLAAIVVGTDGQVTQSTSLKDAIDLARDHRIPIYALRIGSPDEQQDVEVGPLRTQENVFVDDILVVEAPIRASGLTKPMTVTVDLIDETTGVTVATRELVLTKEKSASDVELQTKPTRAGRIRYRVQLSITEDEETTQNNVEYADVNILDSDLRVLYVDTYPRFEYRYLKNALLREPTMRLSVLLIEADDRFVQEGTDPIRRFPETPAELSRFDVVLFGDVDPRSGWLTTAQMHMLLDFVGNEGGGFGLIAGERSTPHRFWGTPLAKLIPVRLDSTFLGRDDQSKTMGFRGVLTGEGSRSNLFRLSADRALSSKMFDSLPNLYWYARTLGPKPGASVLVEHPTERAVSGPMPVIVTGRYGAGRLFFQATDDTWRWRRHTGEHLHDTYWVRVARFLMPQLRVAQNRKYVLRTDRRTYDFGDPVRVELEVFDALLLAEQPTAISIAVTAAVATSSSLVSSQAGPTALVADRNRLRASVEDRLEVLRVATASNRFEGRWVAPRPGRYLLEVADIVPQADDRPASSVVRIKAPDLEARKPQADHEVLERMADLTGGRVLNLDELVTGFARIEDRSVQIPDDIVESLWDSKLVLILFVSLISMEWILRKAFHLL